MTGQQVRLPPQLLVGSLGFEPRISLMAHTVYRHTQSHGNILFPPDGLYELSSLRLAGLDHDPIL